MPPTLLAMKARLAAAALLAALLVPSASAQSQFIYVANSGDDTVSKIDINTDSEVARYATWFTPSDPLYSGYVEHGLAGPAPSRIARDTAGYFYVLNRFFPDGQSSANAHLPVLLKIAPFGGVSVTTTSNGPTNVLQMHDVDGDKQIDSGEAADVRILWGKAIGTGGDEGALGRALCMDPSGYLWVGMHNTKRYYKVDPATGTQVGAVVSTNNHTPYGCQVDTQGRLWSVDNSKSTSAYPGYTLAEIDTVTHQLKAIRDHGPNNPAKNYGRNYSLSLFNGCGWEPTKVYLSEWQLARTYIAYDPQTNSFSNPPGTGSPPVPLFNSIAIGVDLNGNIVSGQYGGVGGGRVIKTTPAGAVVWDTSSPLVNSTVSTSDLHGIIIDSQNNVWAVDRANDQVVKYDGTSGALLAKVTVGDSPYTYGNPPAPACPCAVTSEPQIKCKGKDKDGKWVYSWSFVVTNNSPFSMSATTVDLSIPANSPIKSLTPQPFKFATPLPPKGQATVTGSFTLDQPLPGTEICFDIRLNAGDGWCCPLEHVCFIVPDCTCATLEGVFKCSHGRPYLELSVTNLGPTAAAGVQVFSNTPGVMVTPSMTMQNFPQNTAVAIPLTVTGATPGQVINLTVNLHGPIDDKTGVFSWCCMSTVKVTYPVKLCWWWWDGEIFDDFNLNGLRDSGEGALPEWTVTLTPEGKGTPRTTKSEASGAYHFEEIEPGKYRLSVQPPQGWRATTPKGGAYPLTVEAPPKDKLDFGFVKTRP